MMETCKLDSHSTRCCAAAAAAVRWPLLYVHNSAPCIVSRRLQTSWKPEFRCQPPNWRFNQLLAMLACLNRAQRATSAGKRLIPRTTSLASATLGASLQLTPGGGGGASPIVEPPPAGVHLVGLRSKYSSALDMPPHDQQRSSPATDVDVRARAFATGAPTTLPALAPRPLPRAVMCPLSSLNDPDNYGLGVNPQGSGESVYYWQQLHSMSNPREVVASSGCRTGSPSTLPCQVRTRCWLAAARAPCLAWTGRCGACHCQQAVVTALSACFLAGVQHRSNALHNAACRVPVVHARPRGCQMMRDELAGVCNNE